jgi:hypothetical protein
MDYSSKCGHQSADYKLLVCDCATESKVRVIQNEFTDGDIIGLTYIGQGIAAIAVGTFRRLVGTIVVVDEFLLPGNYKLCFPGLLEIYSIRWTIGVSS